MVKDYQLIVKTPDMECDVAACSWAELMTLVPSRVVEMLKQAGVDTPDICQEAVSQRILRDCRK